LTKIKINQEPPAHPEPEKEPSAPENPAETAGSEEPAREETLEERLNAKEKEARENYDRWLRATAEFENVKKRLEKEKNDTYKFANESLIKELLPVLDNLERAIDHGGNGEEAKAVMEGVEMTLKGFRSALEKFGVTVVEALGKEFDPNLHEAVMVQEDARHPGGTVLHQMQKGYLLHSRLVRPAMVVVSKRPEGSEEENGIVGL
jgi:molecular chaperone GrpE